MIIHDPLDVSQSSPESNLVNLPSRNSKAIDFRLEAEEPAIDDGFIFKRDQALIDSDENFFVLQGSTDARILRALKFQNSFVLKSTNCFTYFLIYLLFI